MSENFEQQARHLLDDVQLEPHASVWENVRHAIQPKQRRRRFIFWWLLPFALTATGVVYYFNKKNDHTNQNNQVAKNASIAERNDHSIPRNNTSATDQSISAGDKPVTTHNANETTVRSVAASSNSSVNKRSLVATTNKKTGVVKTSSKAKTVKAGKISMADSPSDDETQEVVAATPSKEIIVVKGAADSVAKETVTKKQDEHALQKKTITDTATATPPIAVEKESKQKSKWSFGVSAEAGLTTATEGGLFNFGQKAIMDASANPSSLPTSGGFTSVNYQHTTASAKTSFGLYITAHRKLPGKFSFQSSLGYRQQSFSILSTSTKDSFTLVSVITYPLLRTSTNYRFHFINLYTGTSFRVLKLSELCLSVGAGIDNQFLFKAKQTTNEDFLFLNQNNVQSKDASLSSYNKWQPTLRLQLVADINSGKRKWMQLSPYFNFGLQSFEKVPSTNKKQLASFGLTASYFFK